LPAKENKLEAGMSIRVILMRHEVKGLR